MPRDAAAGLPTPHPIADQLPGVLAEDDFTRRFTQALENMKILAEGGTLPPAPPRGGGAGGGRGRGN